jgi:hypothetical protein
MGLDFAFGVPIFVRATCTVRLLLRSHISVSFVKLTYYFRLFFLTSVRSCSSFQEQRLSAALSAVSLVLCLRNKREECGDVYCLCTVQLSIVVVVYYSERGISFRERVQGVIRNVFLLHQCCPL